MKNNRIIPTVLLLLLTPSALMAQTAAPAAPAARGGRGGAQAIQVQGATADQQTALTGMEQGVAPLVQAAATARTDLATVTFAQPRNEADLRAKLDALGKAEQALAAARAEAFARLQATPNSLNAAQIQSLVVAQLGTAAPAGGRGGGARAGGGGQKTLLIWADTRNGQAQHEFPSHAMAVIERLGYESGAYRTFIRTDSEIISYRPQKTSGGAASGGPNLGSVDAIFSLVHREAPLPEPQRAELMKFIKEDGKGFITAHTGLTAFESWPEFKTMIGGSFGGHNIGYAGTVINEDPSFPGLKDWPARIDMQEEWYSMRGFSRENSHVVLRLDRNGEDFPVAWAKMYGNGRVFASTFAHATETWDDPKIQKMYFEAIKWALKLTDADITPRPLPSGPAAAPR